MFRSLMTSRRFAPLFWCQFFSAFNDNVLKNALVFLILFKVGASPATAAMLVTVAGALFVAPPLILSGLGGQWADRYDKAWVAQKLKLFEIAAALFSVLGFVLVSLPLLFTALVLFSTVAALFSPVKYGMLPDQLRPEELPTGNALVEGGTFIAILLGTIAGGWAAADGNALTYGLVVSVFALLCWGSALLIPATNEGDHDLAVDANIFRSTGQLVTHLHADRRLWSCGLFVSWFWLTGAVALTLLPILVKADFHGSEGSTTAALAIFSVGIAVGSGLASWLSAGRVILLPTAVASVLLGLFSLDLGWGAGHFFADRTLGAGDLLSRADGIHAAVDLFMIAVSGGLFIVPVFTAVQVWSTAEDRARNIGAVNILSAGFMVAGAVATAALQAVGLTTPQLFAVLGVANLVAAWWIFRTLPTSGFRDLLSMILRCFYRMDVTGLENFAKAGPNPIIALNHVSLLDAGLALSLLDEEPVFAIDATIATRWWVKPFLKLTKALPIDPSKPMATRALINAVRDGSTLVIFPEGRITRTGSLMKVYDGAGLIADKTGVPVVPVRIDGLERTPFSYLTVFQTRPRMLPKVHATVLEPRTVHVPEGLFGKKRRQAAGAALYDVMSEAAFRTSAIDRTIVEATLAAGEEHGWKRVALEDPIAGALTYKRVAVGLRVLGAKLMALAPEGRAVGVMLPTAAGTAVTVLALQSAGRVPAMINFTAGAANVRAACAAAGVDTVLTSRAFVEKAKLDRLAAAMAEFVTLVYLEDVRATITAADKLRGLLAYREPLVRRGPGDPAAILFTSGSEGAPKGVVVSHRNLLANVAQVAARIDFGRADKIFQVLPMFHAFGLMAGLVLPLVSGVPVYLYPSPLHYRIVPELVYANNCTAIFGTDTFLAGYARSSNAYDFRSLRLVVAGAEAVKDATRKVYLEKFGLRILEGYGITETGPVLAVNTPMFNRFGTVGRLLPDIEHRLQPVDGVEGGGRLSVRGPNVMLGYVRGGDLGALEPPPGGWHDTGDIVDIDAEGFVSIKGRAKRFAKIAGEMVSLAALEAVAADLWPDSGTAATTLPDPRKGERIVLVTEKRDATRQAFASYARDRGVADVAMPSEVVVVEALPLLGSGKLDHPAVGRLVRERAEAKRPEPAVG
ncbi:acyl-[ACP]--phospholipid O-acyltransferase [Lichenibacterium minor]|uniref:Acyl-[ACP]--phospholipid O-acyltransferase n=1 Tax=Lichenibacterium minor TaxID=2316528 RepID=A0A4Q2UAV9_9HYPH|nr:acyl-[ACP]--phospholipid O-acyltransferase [Lichenibacterium minor]RYC33780.1 acyl-[ACP]--phospholipid O-acyltransferase [Lichenibacterium minor]